MSNNEKRFEVDPKQYRERRVALLHRLPIGDRIGSQAVGAMERAEADTGEHEIVTPGLTFGPTGESTTGSVG